MTATDRTALDRMTADLLDQATRAQRRARTAVALARRIVADLVAA